jgi:hypothetical protein
MLDRLSNGRVEVWDEILEWPVRKFFNVLLYYRQKGQKERIENGRPI